MIRTCASCGKSNRVPAQRLADTGRCGACKAELPPLDAPIDLADPSEWSALVEQSRVPVLVDFWADWCGPCHAAAPHVKQVAREMKGRALVVKVDTERHGHLAAKFGVRGIPNFVVLKAGRPVMQQAGLVDAHTMAGWLEQAGA